MAQMKVWERGFVLVSDAPHVWPLFSSRASWYCQLSLPNPTINGKIKDKCYWPLKSSTVIVQAAIIRTANSLFYCCFGIYPCKIRMFISSNRLGYLGYCKGESAESVLRGRENEREGCLVQPSTTWCPPPVSQWNSQGWLQLMGIAAQNIWRAPCWQSLPYSPTNSPSSFPNVHILLLELTQEK